MQILWVENDYFYFQNLKLGLHKKTEIFLSGDLLLARDRSYPWSRPSPRPILVTILEESEKKLGLGQKTKKKSIIYIQKQNGRQAHMGPIIYFIKGRWEDFLFVRYSLIWIHVPIEEFLLKKVPLRPLLNEVNDWTHNKYDKYI